MGSINKQLENEYKLSNLILNLRKPERLLVKIINKILNISPYKLVKKKELIDYFLYEYKSYQEYVDVQVFTNKRKLNSIFADKKTLGRVYEIVSKNSNEKIKGLCHGTRNGFEQNYLNSLNAKMDVIGSDISDTAVNYKNSYQWDFHNPKKEWINKFDFIYSNSLDQSWKPKEALEVWLKQLNRNGMLVIEHTYDHSPIGACKTDPFGVKPIAMPYVLTMFFGDQISISHSVDFKDTNGREAWLFVIKKNTDEVKILA